MTQQTLVLVIDDEADIRENLVAFLQLEGHRVAAVAHGQEGLRAMRAERPDLILCDVMMPHLNGFDMLAAMMADPALRDIPLLFLSASAEPEKLEEGLKMGARGYITKPFNLLRLRELMAPFVAPGKDAG